ncbi:NlpC/P60 family protein [Streptomyces sp. NPDC007929]|uniref:C40 family peptidase n=1 Tax=unclassified Streptomyces TaxID=2593676 RepID=UPI0036E8E5CF
MPTESEAPSPDEVRRYVDRLYDRAENDTGRFNATRAASIPRQRGASDRDRSRENTEPALGGLARQWFDLARAKLGPTVPASLPEKRPPALPEHAPRAARPARPVERPAEPLALEAPRATSAPELPEAPTRSAWELTGGSAAAPPTAVLRQLPGRPDTPAAAGAYPWGESASAWRADAPPALGDAVVGPWPPPEPEPVSAPATVDVVPAPEPTAVLPAPEPTALLPSVAAPAATYLTGPPDITAPAATAGAPARPTEATSAPAFAAPAAAATPAPQVTPAAWESITVTSAAYGGPWQSPDAGHRTQAERVIDFARAQIGRPCVWGAVGPGSYDAPGLTQAAWKAAGVTLPRATEAQWRAGAQVALTDVQVGDLVFFHDDLRHVGICSGNGTMIHAPGPGARICEESVYFAGQAAIKGVIRPA